MSEAIWEEISTDITALYNRLVVLADPKADQAYDEALDRLEVWLTEEKHRRATKRKVATRTIRMSKAVDQSRYR